MVLGASSYFITISGDELFLNENLTEIVELFLEYNKPKMLNIASNGILTDKILNVIEKILDCYNGNL